ncbi:glycosyltransferase family 90 protein [Canariomyces notabilis]|uniref:Glycosyltransferase family 90 protein n=1 Tax=Canariomyces notabilis TaxID=2074819 RepID=A0AAN6QFW7_9PEZI|nr:glycosyltransferase family 90 protein [Canariomyces arenarius]
MFSAGAALLFSALVQYLTTPNVELPSEVVCWATLPAVILLVRRYGSVSRATTSKTLLGTASRASGAVPSTKAWLFALGVGAACWYRAEERIIVLWPALTPLLLLAGVGPVTTSIKTGLRVFPPPLTARWSSGLIAAFSCVILVGSSGISLPSLAVCVAVVALLYGGYLAISSPASAVDGDAEHAGGQQGRGDAPESSQVEDMALSLGLRILPILAIAMGVRFLVSHELQVALFRVVMVASVKALSWFFTLKATRDSSWCVSSTIGTFAITSTYSSALGDRSSYAYAASHLVASLLSLGQTIDMVPKESKPRTRLWALGVLPLMAFIVNMGGIGALRTLFPPEKHPIEVLARAAEADFDAMLGRQSFNYMAAVLEYQRRYNLEPPSGFEAWYDFAVAHASPIIDEFDMIHQAIAPFLKMSGQEVREAMAQAIGAKDGKLCHCEFKGETGETRCNNPQIQGTLLRWLGGVTGKIPDVEFLVNPLDEPRVMLPEAESTGEERERVRVTNLSRKPVWDVLTRGCAPESGSLTLKKQGARGGINTHGLPFVTDTNADKDLCRHPEYRDMHGIAMSPTTFLLVDGAVPVLSSGTLTTMADVLFPSPAYAEDGFVYDEGRDMEWDLKANNLYWAGSTTGGWAANDDEWKKYHRHRFVALAQDLEPGKTYWYLRKQDGVFHRAASSLLGRDLFDVGFTTILQCRDDICDSEKQYFDVLPRADKDAALASKLVFDLDGNGISGRFVKLLSSRSAVLKQTLFREWHDERLAAWVHYIPVSQDLGEVPELVSWLTGTEEGRARAKTVAERGREWAARAMRDEDRAVYIYRLMLELARIQDPERPAM